MKNIQKIILPGLVIVILALLYFSYFAPSDELGVFSKLDSNSSAALPIVVKMVKEKGIQRAQDGTYIFYVLDGENKEMLITGVKDVPPGMDDAKTIVLTGHLSGNNSFHAHGVELRN